MSRRSLTDVDGVDGPFECAIGAAPRRARRIDPDRVRTIPIANETRAQIGAAWMAEIRDREAAAEEEARAAADAAEAR